MVGVPRKAVTYSKGLIGRLLADPRAFFNRELFHCMAEMSAKEFTGNGTVGV
jgi:hypothetical protein